MSDVYDLGGIFCKLLKLVLNFIILILYRVGYAGQFLGIGGTWNLNEEKNPDAEIVASGVFVGYFIYTTVSLIGAFFSKTDLKNTFTDILMNIIGVFMWLACGATALHYWIGYQSEYKFNHVATERQFGIAVGALCVINGVFYILDTIVSSIHFARVKMNT